MRRNGPDHYTLVVMSLLMSFFVTMTIATFHYVTNDRRFVSLRGRQIMLRITLRYVRLSF
jgi:hypothetical protein